MKCQEIRDEIILYHADELDERARQAVETHCAGCPACLAFSREIAAAVAAAHRVRPAGPRVDVWLEVRERIGKKPAFFPRWAPVSLAAVLVAGVLFTKTFVSFPGNVNRSDRPVVSELEFLADYELWEDLDTLESL